MAFTIPDNLHPDLMPLAWLIGTWRGKGRGEYPNVPGFQFAQEVSFNHDGRAFLNYFSRSWIIDENDEIIRPAASEVGFWRIKEKNVLEVYLHITRVLLKAGLAWCKEQRFNSQWIKVTHPQLQK
jgi:hypothetical protein